MNRHNRGGGSTLVYAVRPRVILRYAGQICVVLGVLSVPPLVVAVLSGEHRVSLAYCATIAVLAAIGAIAARMPVPREVQRNEGLVISASVFTLGALLLALPLSFSGDLPASSALFEAVSAVTTTGLSARDPSVPAPFAFHFGRTWSQWYGGLGIVVLSLALVTGPGITARQLSGNGMDGRNLIGNTVAFARTCLYTYVALTAAGVVVLWLAGLGGTEALLHAMSAVSTGGFAPHAESLGALGSWHSRFSVILLCALGAVPLVLYRMALRDRRRALGRDVQLPGLAAAAVAVSAAMAAALFFADHLPLRESLGHGAIVGLSAQTTAGFTSLPVADLSASAKLVAIVSMFVGGGVGSTAGGIKILRLLVLMRLLQVLVRRTCMPRHAVEEARLGGRRLEGDEIQQILCLILLFVLVVVLSWMAFVLHGYDPLDSLFEVVSATGTVGLSTGLSGPELPSSLKAVLAVDMLLGRLEIVAFLVLLYPRAWFGRRLEGR